MQAHIRSTLPAQLIANAQAYGDRRLALREKEFAIWREVSWAEYLARVRALALGLRDLGLRPGDTICIMTDNRPEWLYAELAAQSLRVLPLGLYSDMEDLDLIRYLLDFADVRIAIVEDQEQSDKVLAVKDALPNLERIIVDEFHELRGYDEALLMSYGEVMGRGESLAAKDPELYGRLVEQVRPDDGAVLSTTSGTTGLPKLALLSHRNLLAMPKAVFDQATAADAYVSFLPPAWIGERMVSLSWALACGFAVNFPEKPETVQRDMREIGPTIMFAPPRIWEKMVADVQVKIADADLLKRSVYRLCLPVGEYAADCKLQRRPLPFIYRLLHTVADGVLFRKLRDHLGLSRLRYVYTGGAALGPDVFRFFQAMGVRIKQVYGQTETGGIVVMHRTEDVRLDTVGEPLPGVEVAISEHGEILIKGTAVFKAYYKNPEATEKALVDGWLHTGDQGLVDESGHLVMIDRLGDVMELADGRKFSPQYIENKLKFSPYIREAIVIGHQRPYVAALVQIDMDTVGKWAENRQLAFTTFADLSQKAEVYQLVQGEVTRVNGSLPEVARVRRFTLLSKELDPEDEELTQTQKVRRRAVAQKYAAPIEALYGEPGAAAASPGSVRVETV